MFTLEKLNRFPPDFCRLLARTKHGHRLMSRRDLARASGLSEYKVALISHCSRWDNIPMADAFAYIRGIGLNFGRLRSGVFWKLNRGRGRAVLANLTGRQLEMVTRILTRVSKESD